MVVGGVWSLIKLFKPLVVGIKASLDAVKHRQSGADVPKEEQDIPINYVGYALIALLVPVFFLYLGIIESVGIAALFGSYHDDIRFLILCRGSVYGRCSRLFK